VNKKVLESLIKVGAMSKFGSRASLLENLDLIRSKVVKPKDNGNQQDLFGGEDIDRSIKSKDLDINLHGEEYKEEKLEQYERELLGFALTTKPIEEVLEPVKSSATHSVSELIESENLHGSGKSKKVRVAAVVTEVRVIVTKKSGKEMAFVQVNDGSGTIDLVVFPRIYSESRSTWVKAKPILVSGKTDTRDETISILVDEVVTVDEFKNKKKLMISVPKNATAEQMKELKKVLKEHPGSDSAVLSLEGVDKNITLPFKITWDKTLARKINTIFS
jgi:DNA polymerase-3 subunit alpha